MARWDLAAMAAGAAWLSSVVVTATEHADSQDTEALQHFLLATAGVATAVVYIERSRKRAVAEISRLIESERRFSHLNLIEIGRAMGSDVPDAQVVPLRARSS